MIIFKDEKTDFEITEQEINVCICRLLAFVRINKQSKGNLKLKERLEKLEDRVAAGSF